MGQFSNGYSSKVIKGRVIPAAEIEKRIEKNESRINRLKKWFQSCNCNIFSSFQNCFTEKIKESKHFDPYIDIEKKNANKCVEFPHQKLTKVLSQKSTVYCVDQPKFDEFNKSFETDIDSNKQDNLSMGYELDVNNTLRRTFSKMINQLQTSKTVSQQSNFFSTNNLNYQEPITNEITFSNLFGNLDNFLNEDSLEFYSNYDSESDRESEQSFEYDHLSYSNSEAFYEQTIIYEYTTRF